MKVKTDISDEKLAELKICELNILKCFISICDKIGVRYFLVGGTLLGAVRHKGFIPWDDDIDVGMFRSDYEIFISEAPKLLPDYYFLQNSKSDNQFPYCFSKIRDSRTTFIESVMKGLDINHGVFIDIFAFDSYPESRFSKFLLEAKKKVLKTRIEKEFYYNEPLQRTMIGRMIEKYALIRYPKMHDALRAQDKLFQSCKESPFVTNYSGAWGKREIVKKNLLEESCILEFEGIKVIAPKYYHEYLTNVYGDYMKLPPVEQQVGHHYTEYIDLKKPYTFYINKCDI